MTNIHRLMSMKNYLSLLMSIFLLGACSDNDLLDSVARTAAEAEQKQDVETLSPLTKKAVKRLVGKWQLVYANGTFCETDTIVEFFEDGKMKLVDKGANSVEATFKMVDDWERRSAGSIEMLAGHVDCDVFNLITSYQEKYNALFVFNNNPANGYDLCIKTSAPVISFIDPSKGFKRIE